MTGRTRKYSEQNGIQIRAVEEEDVEQIIQLSKEVQRDMAEDIIKYHLKFIIQHPWPYTIMSVFAILIYIVKEVSQI